MLYPKTEEEKQKLLFEGKRIARLKKVEKMHHLYGPGPVGRQCNACAHLFAKQFAGRYFKCELFGNTGGPGTDWRVRWPACGKFQERLEAFKP